MSTTGATDASRPQTQMYQPQPMMPQQQMMYQQPVTINKVVSSKAWHNTKIAIGSLILVSDIIIFGLGGGSASTIVGIYDMLIMYPLAGVSLIWQIAEFITLCAHPDRGIHPGAHVGMHLILWLGAAGCAGMLTTFVVIQETWAQYWRGTSSSRRGLISDYIMYQRLEAALAAFAYILLILHFTFFVRACIECQRRNTQQPTIMMAAPPQPYYPANGMGQMPPQQALYPSQYNPHMSMQPQQHNPHMSMNSVPAPQQAARSDSFGYYAPPAAGHHETAANGEHKTDIPHTGSPAPVSTISGGDHVPTHHTQGHPTRNLDTV